MKKDKREISIVRSSAAEYLTFITATGKSDVILSILVDTFSSRILNPMLLPSGKRNIVVF